MRITELIHSGPVDEGPTMLQATIQYDDDDDVDDGDDGDDGDDMSMGIVRVL